MSLRSRTTDSPAEILRGGEKEAVVPVKSPSLPHPSSRTRKALSGTAHLANLLPTGTLLAFQILTPIFTTNGACDSMMRSMTQFLLLVLASTASLACFTDSFRSTSDGELYLSTGFNLMTC
ncbi:hypothetical protein ZOSMA_89G00360 [Zostera marina]|uniref:Uncharacterized protein n=1 Tax=Zostera marina TaxID=29655 RepID=A0A0K9NM75_ZOSMR|nr:hypothetical protein ZOSMA_89G00360 [Zostera marina]